MRDQLPPSRADWAPAPPTGAERAVLRRYLAAVSGADLAGVADLLAEDVRTTMPPFPLWFAGRSAVLGALAASWDPALPAYVGRLHLVPVTANGGLAAAAYALRPGDPEYRPFAISVAGFEQGRIAELTAFHDTALFPAFGLPMSFPADGRLNEGPPS
jgi:RNA polymerase sigma-70 factor (ECF subfamily)